MVECLVHSIVSHSYKYVASKLMLVYLGYVVRIDPTQMNLILIVFNLFCVEDQTNKDSQICESF